mmetsp:Transcript_57488/g.115412  ORF Transcript_57488/g.115412 Transcript_57488/m.115412 type:complete len:235 (-) Transcript_57488:2039-2743(-)
MASPISSKDMMRNSHGISVGSSVQVATSDVQRVILDIKNTHQHTELFKIQRPRIICYGIFVLLARCPARYPAFEDRADCYLALFCNANFSVDNFVLQLWRQDPVHAKNVLRVEKLQQVSITERVRSHAFSLAAALSRTHRIFRQRPFRQESPPFNKEAPKRMLRQIKKRVLELLEGRIAAQNDPADKSGSNFQFFSLINLLSETVVRREDDGNHHLHDHHGNDKYKCEEVDCRS